MGSISNGSGILCTGSTRFHFNQTFLGHFNYNQIGESKSCFPWACGAQCFFALGRFGQSLLLFLFELAAGCMFVLKLSEQIENQLIGLKTS